LAEEHLFEAYQKKIRDRMNEMADAVATGSAQSFDEYRKMCGIIEGLALAELKPRAGVRQPRQWQKRARGKLCLITV